MRSPTDQELTPRQVRQKQRKQRLDDFKLFELMFRVWWLSAKERETMNLERADVDERLRLGQLHALERAAAQRLIKAVIDLDAKTFNLVAETLRSLKNDAVVRAVAIYSAIHGRGKIKDIRAFVAHHLQGAWKLDRRGNLSPQNQKKLDRVLDRKDGMLPFVRIRTRTK